MRMNLRNAVNSHLTDIEFFAGKSRISFQILLNIRLPAATMSESELACEM